jgi:6-phosphogluconate dehydrogenase
MQMGMVGLGRMGMNMVRRLLRGRHRVVAYNRSSARVDDAAGFGAKGAYSLQELVSALRPPRVVWVMLPAGQPTEDAIYALSGLLEKGDMIVDGGNGYYKDDIRRAGELSPLGINYMDAGVSGGVWGLRKGYCLMLGGERKTYRKVLPLLRTLAPKDGYLYCGPAGAGHFVKMVHNGIEYGMMSAYGEGFEIMKASPYGDVLNFSRLARLWNRGSVIRSWLLELAEAAFKKDTDLTGIKGYVDDSGEGRWTVQQALDTAVSAPVTAASIFQRFRSRKAESFSDKVLAALRQQFGGHSVVRK